MAAKPAPSRRRVLIAAACVLAAAAAAGGYLIYRKVFQLRRFHTLVPGQLYHSRQPSGPQYAVIQRRGLKRIINLRHRDEDPPAFDNERRLCQAAGVDFVNVAVNTAVPTEEHIAGFLRAVRSRPGPVLWHCEHGRQRTFFMRAVWRIVMDNCPAGEAIAEIHSHNAHPKEADRWSGFQEALKGVEASRAAWRARTAPEAATTRPQTRPSSPAGS